jgi:hypothetical protein
MVLPSDEGGVKRRRGEHTTGHADHPVKSEESVTDAQRALLCSVAAAVGSSAAQLAQLVLRTMGSFRFCLRTRCTGIRRTAEVCRVFCGRSQHSRLYCGSSDGNGAGCAVSHHPERRSTAGRLRVHHSGAAFWSNSAGQVWHGACSQCAGVVFGDHLVHSAACNCRWRGARLCVQF